MSRTKRTQTTPLTTPPQSLSRTGRNRSILPSQQGLTPSDQDKLHKFKGSFPKLLGHTFSRVFDDWVWSPDGYLPGCGMLLRDDNIGDDILRPYG